MISWNPWHGCTKYSEGCQNCYVFRLDKIYGRDSSFKLNKAFDLPIQQYKNGVYKYPKGSKFFTCYTSDFFLDDADQYRDLCWEMIKRRSDCYFRIITKRIDQVAHKLPIDWGKGYPNVEIVCTIENQRQADYRLPIYASLPIAHKALCVEPMLSQVSIEIYDPKGMGIEYIIAGGESGSAQEARFCREEWVARLYNMAHKYQIPFCFKQTGTNFITLSGEEWYVRRHEQMYRAYELPYQDFLIQEL